MDFVQRLLATATALEGQAALIRAGQAQVSATVAGVSLSLSPSGVISGVDFTAEALAGSAGRLTESFLAAHTEAVTALAQAAAATLPPELIQEGTAPAGMAAAPSMPTRPQHSQVRVTVDPTAVESPAAGAPASTFGQWREHDREVMRTGKIDWPEGIEDGPLDAVIRQWSEQLHQRAARQQEVATQVAQVSATSALPAGRPMIELTVDAAGQLTGARFTAAAVSATTTELSTQVMAALAEATQLAYQEAAQWLDQ